MVLRKVEKLQVYLSQIDGTSKCSGRSGFLNYSG
jgi:hypothetical protein